MGENWIIVKTFNSSVEAALFKAKLSSEGIEARILDEHTVSVNPLASVAIGGVKVQVRTENLQAVNDLVQEMEASVLEDEDGQPISCPQCGSSRFYSNINSLKSIKGFINALIPLLFGVYPLSTDQVHCCKDCNTEFKVN